MLVKKAIFVAAVVFCLSPYGSPPMALAAGLLIAFTFGNPFPQVEGKVTKYLLQTSVVLLGFGMNLKAVYEAGKDGIVFTIVTIFGTLALGYAVGKLLGIAPKTSTLISSGTAICGGSAIAAVAPVIGAEKDEITVSLGTVFVLNSIALFVFPIIGHLLGLTQHQFGVWSAVAIHDTSSVVGASASYGPEALITATTVKLARALWIAPVALLFAYIYRERSRVENRENRDAEAESDISNLRSEISEGEDSESKSEDQKPKSVSSRSKIAIPWFILLFLIATALRSYLPIFPSIFDSLVNLAKAGLTVTLFFIGGSLSRETLSKFGYWALLQGVILWFVISVVSLWAIYYLI